jgi:hypothetical protein
MSKLTATQLTATSAQFAAIANAILNYRMSATLSDAQDQQLEGIQKQLLSGSNELAAQSAVIAGTEAGDAISQLNQVTNQISQTIIHLAEVQKVINIAAASLKVVTSVIRMNPQNIISSVEGLIRVYGN